MSVHLRPFTTDEVNQLMQARAANDSPLIHQMLDPHVRIDEPWEAEWFLPTGKHTFLILEKDQRNPYMLEWNEAIWLCNVCGIYWMPGISEHCISYRPDNGPITGALEPLPDDFDG